MAKMDHKRNNGGFTRGANGPKNGRSPKNQARPAERFERELDENTIIGRNAVRELLQSGRDVEKLYITSSDKEGSINQLIGIASERGVPIVECDRTKLDSMACGGRHQGIIAIAAERNYSTIDDILAYAAEKGVDTPLRVTNIKPGLVETNFSVVRFRGDKDKADNVYKGIQALTGDDIAEVAYFAASAPEHMQVAEILVMPTNQATGTIVSKK